jgi:hypothetical protein
MTHYRRQDWPTPGKVVPMVIFLASRACELSHQNYSACAGHYSRAFIGVEHLSEVSSIAAFSIPGTVYEELFAVVGRLGVSVSP